ncbi:hypothetical protein [Nocardia sp. XZ_19_385]|uniref:hypothetical protein n=1 Tax=Nocardia sp. XZ_19_385 TaxID=2769488 RepID=UPI00188F0E68|nr:hypothetical protein [Nocardia sp. XZ_19_385]
MSDIDPLSNRIDDLQAALGQGGSRHESPHLSVEIAPDGGLLAVHLTDSGRLLTPNALAAEIVRVQSAAVAGARKAVAAAIAAIENDPRLQALTERGVDALNQPLPTQPARRHEPTQEEEEEMDRYYQRKSWLE